VAILAAISILGLFNVFGQCSRTTVDHAATATLSVDGPTRVRGGLVFTSEVVFTAEVPISNARIFLARGWFQGMSVNTIEPSPVTQSSNGPWIVLAFGRMPAHRQFHLWLSLQTNPTNVGSHDQTVALYDGAASIALVHRSLFVFP
jgi:hypothetical protein